MPRRTKLPAEIRADDYVAVVKTGKRLPPTKTMPTQGEYRGVDGTGKTGTIRISPGLTRLDELKTLLHEVLHFTFDMGDIQLNAGITMRQEEIIVAGMEGWLTTILLQNPELRALLDEASDWLGG